jgi:hypothetical protein
VADLGEVLGSILSSVAHARRIADEETATIAERYREEPLLEGMSLPRLRLPELVIELPVVVQDETPGDPGEIHRPAAIRKAISARMVELAQERGIDLPAASRKRFEAQLTAAFRRARIRPDHPAGPRSREIIAQATETAFHETLKAEPRERLKPADAVALARDLRREALDVAVKRAPVPPSLAVAIRTEEVKNQADASNVARVKMVLKEEGLEWTTIEDADGTTRRFLVPD